VRAVIGELKQVRVGASVVLPCQSVFHDSVLWFAGEKGDLLYWGEISRKYSDRFKVLRSNASRGIFDLSIIDVQLSDAGIYRCTEYVDSIQHAGEVLYNVTVTGQRILCASVMRFRQICTVF